MPNPPHRDSPSSPPLEEQRLRMKPTRSLSFAFNPEKFLAAEQQKQKENQPDFLPSLEDLLPITFSRSFKRKFIERLEKDAPSAFYRGAEKDKMDDAMGILNAEVIRELKRLRISPDAALVRILVFNVITDPLWRRIWRRKKSASQ
jgi:hypothetical protein